MGIEVALLSAGLALSAVGTAASISGSKAAGKQAIAAGEYNKKIADRNARVADQNAEYRERVGEREELRFRKKFSKVQARAGTAYRKSGVIASSGTPLAVLMENANEAEEDIQTGRLQVATEAGQLRERATGLRVSGEISMLEARARKMSYDIQAKTALFNGLSQMAFGGAQIAQIA